MKEVQIDKIMQILETESKSWHVPIVTLIAIQNKDPFKVLISTIISLRTKDEVTAEASKRLFEKLKEPKDIHSLSESQIEKLIYPTGFYKRKAIQIRKICLKLIEEHNSQVPKDIETLLTFEGVGRKTANLVLTEGYGLAAMCVDTHVHRISNRIGYIKTKTPEEVNLLLELNFQNNIG